MHDDAPPPNFDDLDLSYLWLLGPLWGVWGLAVLVVQIACVVHVFKTGRPYWWMWVIFAAPLVGTVVYVLVEVRPSWKRQNWQGLLWRLKSPREKIRLREAWLLDSPTQTNRLLLVDELVAVGNYERAANVLEEGLRGPFASDAELLLRLADCQLELGRGEAAAASLARMDEVRARDLVLRKQTTQARVSAATGDLTAAEKLFQDLQRQDHTEAPRYYFGQFLIRTGRTAEGKQVLRDLITRYRRGTTVWRMQEKTWFQAAHRLLRATR